MTPPVLFNEPHDRPCCRWARDFVNAGSGCMCSCHEPRSIDDATPDEWDRAAAAALKEQRVTAKSGAVKADGGKRRLDLVPVGPLLDIADVLTFGANKYADRNWEKGFPYGRVYGAAMRHLLAWWNGEDRDPETGMSHLAHAATCLMFLLEYEHTLAGEDDRPYRRGDYQ